MIIRFTIIFIQYYEQIQNESQIFSLVYNNIII